MLSVHVGFIGSGQMASAFARGIVKAGLVAEETIVAHDPSTTAIEQFRDGIPSARSLDTNAAVIEQADVVVLAIKPQNLTQVAADIKGMAQSDTLFVSILAGVDLARLSGQLGTERIIRVMPNTPCLVGCGAAAYTLGRGATQEDGLIVGRLLQAVGVAFQLDEKLLDAVTGLSGSGPAYVYTMIEALSDGGVRMGLPRETATKLAAQTVLGAAQMTLSTAEHPGVLRDRVTSPGGTTIAGLQVLERHGLRSALIDAVEAAAKRATELGRPS
jgi:pyrroline-5-carboxylate reductase